MFKFTTFKNWPQSSGDILVYGIISSEWSQIQKNTIAKVPSPL